LVINLHGSFFDVHVQSFKYGMAVLSHSVALGRAADEDGLDADVTRGSVRVTTEPARRRRNERLRSSGIFLHLSNSRFDWRIARADAAKRQRQNRKRKRTTRLHFLEKRGTERNIKLELVSSWATSGNVVKRGRQRMR
jgi:hypothetical protein